MENQFNVGDKVVMHSCMEATQENGRIWEVTTTSYISVDSGKELVFLKDYSGSFDCKYLQKVDISHHITARREVKEFAVDMEAKLKKNDIKGGWYSTHHRDLLVLLKKEVDELEEAIESGKPERMIEEAADVANFCLMIADNARDTIKLSKNVNILFKRLGLA